MRTLNLNSTLKKRVSRRDFLKLLKIAGLDLALLTLGAGAYLKNVETGWLDIVSVRLALPNLPGSFSGFRLAQISDIHFGSWMTAERLDESLDLVAAQNPDMVAITGDFVMAYESVLHIDALQAALAALAERFPTLAVLGNHDYQYGSSAMVEVLRQAGVEILVNQVYSVQRGGESLHFAGLDDVREGQVRLDSVLRQLPESGCSILMVHEPDYADISAPVGRFDLQLSGHSHGGQVVLPLIGPPVLPRWGRKYPSGLYRVGSMYQYTNRGLGMTPPSIRFNCRPEITILTLERAG
jgi:predicted MPP superfamily phosphohydrolase